MTQMKSMELLLCILMASAYGSEPATPSPVARQEQGSSQSSPASPAQNTVDELNLKLANAIAQRDAAIAQRNVVVYRRQLAQWEKAMQEALSAASVGCDKEGKQFDPQSVSCVPRPASSTKP